MGVGELTGSPIHVLGGAVLLGFAVLVPFAQATLEVVGAICGTVYLPEPPHLSPGKNTEMRAFWAGGVGETRV